jgi:hypothetical protein
MHFLTLGGGSCGSLLPLATYIKAKVSELVPFRLGLWRTVGIYIIAPVQLRCVMFGRRYCAVYAGLCCGSSVYASAVGDMSMSRSRGSSRYLTGCYSVNGGE